MSEPVDFADVPAAFRDDPLKPVGVALLEPVGLKAYGLFRLRSLLMSLSILSLLRRILPSVHRFSLLNRCRCGYRCEAYNINEDGCKRYVGYLRYMGGCTIKATCQGFGGDASAIIVE